MVLAEWDARTYAALALPHERWGREAIAGLDLQGHETVLDLGCGTGRDTRRLLAGLPCGRVVAVDGSQAMLQQLRERLADDLSRVRVVRSDLRGPWHVGGPFDAVVSVATLHWLPDHATVFERVASVLRAGGTFVADAGGRGNIATVRAALRDLGIDEEGEGPWNFADVPETRARLEAAGFGDVEVSLVADPARLSAGEQLESFLATVVLGAHLAEVAADERADFVRDVARRLPEPVVDYVRLKIRAVRR